MAFMQRDVWRRSVQPFGFREGTLDKSMPDHKKGLSTPSDLNPPPLTPKKLVTSPSPEVDVEFFLFFFCFSFFFLFFLFFVVEGWRPEGWVPQNDTNRNPHFGWTMALNRGHNSTRRPPEREERTTFALGEGKKSEILGGPAEGRSGGKPGRRRKPEKKRPTKRAQKEKKTNKKKL